MKTKLPSTDNNSFEKDDNSYEEDEEERFAFTQYINLSKRKEDLVAFLKTMKDWSRGFYQFFVNC